MLFLLAAVNFTHILDLMIVMPLGDALMKEFSISPGQFSAIVSAYMVSAGIFGFIASASIDRFGRKRALLTLYAGFILGTFLVALSTSFIQIIISRAITGAFGGLIGALVLSIASDMYKYKQRGKAIGLITSSFSVASVVGVPLGLYIASKTHWWAPFVVVAALAVVVWLIIFFTFPSLTDHVDERAEKKSPFRHLANTVGDVNQLRALSMGFFIVLGQFLIIPFIAPSMIRNVGFNQETVALVYFFGGMATMFSSPAVGRLTDRYSALRIFRFMMPISFVVVLVLTSLGEVPIWVALVVTTTLFISFNGRMVPAQTMATASVSPEKRGGFMSLKTALQQLAAAAASLISGLIILETDDGKLENFAIIGIMSVCITGVSLFIAPKLKVASGN